MAKVIICYLSTDLCGLKCGVGYGESKDKKIQQAFVFFMTYFDHYYYWPNNFWTVPKCLHYMNYVTMNGESDALLN